MTKQSLEQHINDLRASLDKHTAGGAHPRPDLIAELTKAVHTIGDQLVGLHRRLEMLEENQNEWTTLG